MPRAFLVKRFGASKGQQERPVDEKGPIPKLPSERTTQLEQLRKNCCYCAFRRIPGSRRNGPEISAREKSQIAESYRSTKAIEEFYASEFKLRNDIRVFPSTRCVGKLIANPYFEDFMVASRGISGRRMVNMENFRLVEFNKKLMMSGRSTSGPLIGVAESRHESSSIRDSTDESVEDESADYDWCNDDYDDGKYRNDNKMSGSSNNDSLRSGTVLRHSHIDHNNNDDDFSNSSSTRDEPSSVDEEDSDENESDYLVKGVQSVFIHQHHHEGSHDKLKFGGKSQFQCTQCDKTFKTKYTLNIHRKMPSHTTLKPFVCPTCGKGFRLSSTLCRHKIIHTSQRPHRCHVCQKSFNRSSTLKTHLRTHSNVKEFTCSICGKGFHQKGNLRNHVLIHTGEKPYECNVCKKSFNKLSNLKFHMHSHTDQKPYRCRHCKQSFSKRGELKQHIALCKRDSPRN